MKDDLLYVLRFALITIEENGLKDVKDKNNWILGKSIEELMLKIETEEIPILNEEDSKMWLYYKNHLKEEYERKKEQWDFDFLLKIAKSTIDKDIGIDWNTDGLHGWDCKNSPIKKCIYASNTWEVNGDECCFYCGAPEERK